MPSAKALPAPHFSDATLKFLRGLKRNNDRAWFDARKPIYEAQLKAPILAIIEAINHQLDAFAPEHVRPPAKVMMRIYRDIRFSTNKDPYKTQVAAWWARQGMEKTSAAGFYFHLSNDEVMIAAGAYMPEKDQTLAIRRHLSANFPEYTRILAAKKLNALMQPIDRMKMTRPPKGFTADDPAIDAIMQRQWGVSSSLPAGSALAPTLVKDVVERFKLAAPLVAFLNQPLLRTVRKPLF